MELDINNGIAVIPITGTLWRYSYSRIRREVTAARDNYGGKATCLRVLSPGGLLRGCKELGDFVYDVNKVKPIYTYADGLMCSAAYWIGSGGKMIAAPVTADVGSIGVRMLHIDWSKWNEDMGLAFTHLTAGEYKALGNEDEPLGKKARDYFQGMLDQTYDIFLDSVARQRGMDREAVLAAADGKVLRSA